ncbi:MAG: hypothetical protein OXC66_12805, partial [Roseovarius sp.]|nr:hypothetical protein [Roseovarius sp.]
MRAEMFSQKEDDNPNVFIGRSQEGQLSENTLLKVLELMGYGHVTRHGFRSTFRDWAAETRLDHWAAAKYALAYRVEDAIMRAYQRSDPLEEHHKLMTDWDIYCSSGGSCRFRQQFPLEFLFAVLQWFNLIAENIFS